MCSSSRSAGERLQAYRRGRVLVARTARRRSPAAVDAAVRPCWRGGNRRLVGKSLGHLASPLPSQRGLLFRARKETSCGRKRLSKGRRSWSELADSKVFSPWGAHKEQNPTETPAKALSRKHPAVCVLGPREGPSRGRVRERERTQRGPLVGLLDIPSGVAAGA